MAISNKERAYLKSHPWITFLFDMRKLDYQTWILSGEAKSKCLHVRGAPLLPDVVKSLFGIALVKGALATTAIEGNTLSEEEVARRIQGNLDLPPSKEYLGKEIDNIVVAYNKIGRRVLANSFTQLNVQEIKDFNKLVLDGLPVEKDVVPGEIRKHSVGVGSYRGAPPEDCEYLLEKYVEWLNQDFSVPKGQEMIFGILKAIMSHLYFVWIHPFGDGNGRTARLIEFQILLSVGVPAASAHLMSNHYNATRSEYYRQLDMSSKSKGDVSQFIKYALQGFVDGLQNQIEMIQSQQLYVHWINHVHRTFQDKDREEDKRRRKLVLELSDTKDYVPLTDVRHISPKTAEMYANLTDKTVERDIERLVNLDLVVKEKKKGIRPKWEILQTYLSPAVKDKR
ncbi:MAG TPA: Fic family protein [Anaerolineales bacterium]|nr:Fic family protein [Anaerolineales bacterium]